jgi:hypothetical protein
MTDEKFEDLMRDAAHHYNRPPDVPPVDVMWEEIERRLARSKEEAESVSFPVQRKPSFLNSPWVRMAAMLVVGVGIGRFSVVRATREPASASAPVVQQVAQTSTAVPGEYELVTDHYLGQTAALLSALPGELNAKRPDAAFIARADDLLMQTRRLLDSPAAADPGLHTLFEDLEVVLAQVVRLQGDRDPTRIELLHQALEQRDVIPRLRNAVADHIAD